METEGSTLCLVRRHNLFWAPLDRKSGGNENYVRPLPQATESLCLFLFSSRRDLGQPLHASPIRFAIYRLFCVEAAVFIPGTACAGSLCPSRVSADVTSLKGLASPLSTISTGRLSNLISVLQQR